MVRFADRFNALPSLCPAFLEREAPPKRLPAGKEIIARVRAAARARAAAEREAADKATPPTAVQPRQPDLFQEQFSEDASVPQPQHEPKPIIAEADNADAAPFDPAPQGERAGPVTFLGAARGRMNVPLDAHGRVSGPRGPARPA